MEKMLSERKGHITYYSYYLFGLSNGSPIWNWTNWKKCIPLLQPFIDLCSEIPLIKTSQSIPVLYGKDNQYASYNKDLRFGKMVWNEKNNEKWTTKYVNEKDWTFFDTEIAFPPRSYCHKHRANPELLITIHNENLTGTVNPKIDQAITIHIRADLIEQEKLFDLENYIVQVGAILNWKIAGKIHRETSYKSDLGIGYTDSIWDGTHGVLSMGYENFSRNYIRYGIKRIK